MARTANHSQFLQRLIPSSIFHGSQFALRRCSCHHWFSSACEAVTETTFSPFTTFRSSGPDLRTSRIYMCYPEETYPTKRKKENHRLKKCRLGGNMLVPRRVNHGRLAAFQLADSAGWETLPAGKPIKPWSALLTPYLNGWGCLILLDAPFHVRQEIHSFKKGRRVHFINIHTIQII